MFIVDEDFNFIGKYVEDEYEIEEEDVDEYDEDEYDEYDEDEYDEDADEYGEDVDEDVELFSGERKDWINWRLNFLNFARRKSYFYILLGLIEVPGENFCCNDEDKRLYDLNMEIFYDLALAMSTMKCLRIINKSISDEFPDGNGRLAWEKLNEWYGTMDSTLLMRDCMMNSVKKNYYCQGTLSNDDQDSVDKDKIVNDMTNDDICQEEKVNDNIVNDKVNDENKSVEKMEVIEVNHELNNNDVKEVKEEEHELNMEENINDVSEEKIMNNISEEEVVNYEVHENNNEVDEC